MGVILRHLLDMLRLCFLWDQEAVLMGASPEIKEGEGSDRGESGGFLKL